MSYDKKFSIIYDDVLSPSAMFAAQIMLALLEELDAEQRPKVLDSLNEFLFAE